MSPPAVVFVGAGPGDPELITVRGLRRLWAADVVVHDRLVAPALLAEARPDAVRLDVGKAPGRHCLPQPAINALLVAHARTGARVVRLKGGDPTVFARLAEEVAAVTAAGLAVEIVPGVTAATAAAARAGVSLTERGAASLVVLATGTDHRGEVPDGLDWPLLARAEGTLVFYMGVRGIETITATLVACGRDPAEPALVVQAAGTEGERVVAAPLGAIAARVRRADLRPPAVLIVGRPLPGQPAAWLPLAGLARAGAPAGD
jgi:uroporphyrin-III C-methyltransferase